MKHDMQKEQHDKNRRRISLTNILLLLIAITLIYNAFAPRQYKLEVEEFIDNNTPQVRIEIVKEKVPCKGTEITKEYKDFQQREQIRIFGSKELEECINVELQKDEPNFGIYSRASAKGICTANLIDESKAPKKYADSTCTIDRGIQKYFYVLGRKISKLGRLEEISRESNKAK